MTTTKNGNVRLMLHIKHLPETHPAKLLAHGEVASLDGLRAISVLIVMVAHSGLQKLVPGGFGVTMFFFISGFIITTLLIREQTRNHAIDVGAFYLRRALRLYPALFAFVAAIVLVYAFFGEKPGLASVMGGLLYFVNYLVIFAPTHVLPQGNHLWSLAVEAHFYLVYPWLFMRLTPSLGRLCLALAAVCLAALAFRVGATLFFADKSLVYEYAYQASEARLDSIAFGALCAALLHRRSGDALARFLVSPWLVGLGLAVILATFLVRNPIFRDTIRYTLQGLALMPLVTAAVLGTQYVLARQWLNSRPLLLIGALSYSLYLWHPALFALGEHLVGHKVPGIALGWLFAAVVAAASYTWIEMPMLRIRSHFGSDRLKHAPPLELKVMTTFNPKRTPRIVPAGETAIADASVPTVNGVASSIMQTSAAPSLVPAASSQAHNEDDLPPKAFVDGWPINIANGPEGVRALIAAATKGKGYNFAPLNLDLLVKLRKDAVFADAMRKSRYIIADGWPIAMLGRRQNPSIERKTGADLVLPLVDECARNSLPIYLFGTSPNALQVVEQKLKTQFPALKIAGLESPPLGFDPRSSVADASIRRIRESGARMCFLALGAPKQEIFAARALDQGLNVGFICVGAGLDFVAGSQVRAPALFRDHGMEWLWRLLTSPRRLGARYAACALFLARLTILEPTLRRLTGRTV